MIDLKRRQNVVLGLNNEDYINASQLLKCEIASIKAVSEIESAGSGFLPSGRPKILFEGHYFYRLLSPYGKAAVGAKEVPTVCYPKWTTANYFGGEKEYLRLETALNFCKAHNIPEDIALKSASWGKFQIMGSNYRLCGYNNATDFVNAMFLSEKLHLRMFCNYLFNTFLDDELRAKDWTKFAIGYNGAGYKRNKYDIKMAAAYRKYKVAEAKVPTISTPITIPTFEESEIVDINQAVESKPITDDDEYKAADKPAIEIDLLTSVGAKFNQFKTTILAILTSIGISGASISSMYYKLVEHPYFQLAAVLTMLIGLVFAGIFMLLWLKHRYDLHNQKNEALKAYNLAQLQIRANPDLYNIQFRQ